MTTMVVAFQTTTRVSFLVPSVLESTSRNVVPQSVTKMTKKSSDHQNVVDSSPNPLFGIQKSVATMMLGWTLATSMAMATVVVDSSTDSYVSSSAMDAVTPEVVLMAESMPPQGVTTESSAPSINVVAVEALTFQTGMTNMRHE